MALSREDLLQALGDGAVLYRLCDRAHLPVVLLDAAGRLVHGNATFGDLLGRDPAELTGRCFVEVALPPRVRATLGGRFRIAPGDRVEGFQCPVAGAGGAERVVAWSGAPLDGGGAVFVGVDASGPRGLLGPGADFARVLTAVVEGMRDGLVVIARDGRILWANPAAAKMFDYAEGDLVGQNVAILMPEPDRSRHDRYIARYLETGERRIIGTGRDVTACRRDGTTFPVHLSVSEVRLGQRRIFAGIVRDLSAERAVESALAESRARLAAIQEQHTEMERVAVAGEMAAIVAHEVRTPLNALFINLQLAERSVRRGGEDAMERALGLLDKLKGEVQRINALIEDYLRVARRPDAREPEPVDLDQVVADAMAFIEPQAARVGVGLEVALSSGARVRGQEAKLRQVVLNLALNAVQAMGEQGGGTLYVTVRRDGPEAVLTVRDTGPGIGEAEAARIFRPFVTSKAKGTGLGLSICDRVVRQMGGTIALVSPPGEGACFEVRLPLAGEG